MSVLVSVSEHVMAYVHFDNELDAIPRPDAAPLPRALRRHIERALKKGTPAVSFATYAEGAGRGKAGVTSVTALVFDFDHLPAAVARAIVSALRRLGYAYLLYTSFSHKTAGDDDNCFRVVLVLSRPLSAREYAKVWSALDSDLGGHADRKARDVARLWYIPACPAERLHLAVYEHRDGHAVDVDGVLAGPRLVPEDDAPPTPRRPLPPVPVRMDQARRVAQYRLNNDPEVRERAAQRLGARVGAVSAKEIPCPACGRSSVWFLIDPRRKRKAACSHRKTCGWSGFLDALLDAACGGVDVQ